MPSGQGIVRAIDETTEMRPYTEDREKGTGHDLRLNPVRLLSGRDRHRRPMTTECAIEELSAFVHVAAERIRHLVGAAPPRR